MEPCLETSPEPRTSKLEHWEKLGFTSFREWRLAYSRMQRAVARGKKLEAGARDEDLELDGVPHRCHPRIACHAPRARSSRTAAAAPGFIYPASRALGCPASPHSRRAGPAAVCAGRNPFAARRERERERDARRREKRGITKREFRHERKTDPMGYIVSLSREAEAVKGRQEAAFERCRENCMCGKDALCAAKVFTRCPTCKKLKHRNLGGEHMGEADCRVPACLIARAIV